MVHEVEDFYGVYLLLCQNPRYKGHTYIGYTVDPNRRIKQHNTGSHAGGAWRTSGRGPWEMVLIIHGFPNSISALRFEWAWQHPGKCRRLKHVPVSKRSSESAFQHRWRMVCHMLHAPPWNRLALNVRWLKQDFKLDFPPKLDPPVHMPIVFGPVCSKKINGNKNEQNESPVKTMMGCSSQVNQLSSPLLDTVDTKQEEDIIPVLVKKNPVCAVCHNKLKSDAQQLTCLWPQCSMASDMTCLAQRFLSHDSSHLVPVRGSCPGCQRSVLWGDLIRHLRGCYQNLATSTPQLLNYLMVNPTQGSVPDMVLYGV